MDTNLTINEINLSFSYVGSVEAASLANASYPAGTQAGDLAIYFQYDHDNGTTTTTGTTSTGSPGSPFTVIDSTWGDQNGYDDMSCTISFALLTGANITAGIPSGGPSGGDSGNYQDFMYILRPTWPITSVTLNSYITYSENTETSTTGSSSVVLPAATRAGTKGTLFISDLLYRESAGLPFAFTGISDLSDSGWSTFVAGEGPQNKLFYKYISEVSLPTVTMATTDESGTYYSVAMAYLNIN